MIEMPDTVVKPLLENKIEFKFYALVPSCRHQHSLIAPNALYVTQITQVINSPSGLGS